MVSLKTANPPPSDPSDLSDPSDPSDKSDAFCAKGVMLPWRLHNTKETEKRPVN